MTNSSCRILPPSLKGIFGCVPQEPFNPEFKNLTDSIAVSTLAFDKAVMPNTKYTPLQVCNRLWRNYPLVAFSHCKDSPSTKLKIIFSADEKYKPLLEEAFKTALRLRPDLDISKISPWKIVPTNQELHFIVLNQKEDEPNDPAFRAGTTNALSGSEITSQGNFLEISKYAPDTFAHGKSYAAAVVAHELFHIMLDLTGNNKKYSKDQEEQLGYDVDIGVLETLRIEYKRKSQTAAVKKELGNIEEMLAKERKERASWVK